MIKYGAIIHGGAGNSSPNDPEAKKFLNTTIRSALKMIDNGCRAVDVSEHVIRIMEDSGLYNAGVGSYQTMDGMVEMDAGIMDGNKLECGGVGAITSVKNPISVALKIMRESDHSLIVGKGALEFAMSHGIERHSMVPKTCIRAEEYGTVGVAVLDMYGNMASAVSTGGIAKKMRGRVGDSAIVGCGYYAKNNVGAAVATGNGDIIIKSCVTKRYCDLVASGLVSQDATNIIVKEMGRFPGGEGGIVSVDMNGNFGVSFNTMVMPHAYMSNTMKDPVVSG